MEKTGDQSSDDLKVVMTAIVVLLRDSWPNAINLSPRSLSIATPDKLFLQAALRLQDEGTIMYEALLIRGGTNPCLCDAILTRKGQLWPETP